VYSRSTTFGDLDGGNLAVSGGAWRQADDVDGLKVSDDEPTIQRGAAEHMTTPEGDQMHQVHMLTLLQLNATLTYLVISLFSFRSLLALFSCCVNNDCT